MRVPGKMAARLLSIASEAEFARTQGIESVTMGKEKGFSLIELLIVVAIILIIAAIAIPNLLRSRIAANEASAVGSLRTINTAEVTYASTYPEQGFTDLKSLGGTGSSASPTNALLLDNVLGCTAGDGTATGTCTKSGYKIAVVPSGGAGSFGAATSPYATYFATADPVTPDQTGKRHFYTDASGVIRYNATAPATSSDVPLQ